MKVKYKRLWALWNSEEQAQPVQEVVAPVVEVVPEPVVEPVVEAAEEEPAVEEIKPKTTKKAKA